MRSSWMWTLALPSLGCAPTIAEVGPAIDGSIDDGIVIDEADNGESDGGEIDGGEADPDAEADPNAEADPRTEDEPSREDDPETDLQTVTSGVWIPTAVEVLDDPCDFVDVVRDFFGTDFFDFLPSAFEVSGQPGRFTIQAIDYGAEGPIQCAFVGADFGCAQQSVVPTTFGLGRAGWEYAIDFSGEAPDNQTLEGEATVLYPSTDEGTAQLLGSFGIDIEECAQVFALELSLAR